MLWATQFKNSVKRQDSAWKRFVFRTAKAARVFADPPIPLFHTLLHTLVSGVGQVAEKLISITYWHPVFVSRLANRPKALMLYGRGLPWIAGPGEITMGKGCRVSSRLESCGRSSGGDRPTLHVGDNVDLGWGSGLYVGTHIHIGDNVRIAGQGLLLGFPGHPFDAAARARGEADRDDQARAIVLKDDVWLAKGVVVNAGVTIGEGTIVAAGSVVTKDLPANVLAGGVPARVIRPLRNDRVATFCEGDVGTIHRFAASA